MNNYLKHEDVGKLAKQIKDCGADQACKDNAIDDAYRVSTANDIELLNCRATNNCDQLKAEYRKGYGAIQDLVGAGMDPADVGRILNLEINAQPRSTCSMVGVVTYALGGDIAKWLQRPINGAALGEL